MLQATGSLSPVDLQLYAEKLMVCAQSKIVKLLTELND